MKKFKVYNTTTTFTNYKYAVIRDCGEHGYWYYGAYNDLLTAQTVANDLCNGVVVETESIEPSKFGE